MTEPLPYIVKLRTLISEDLPPVVSEVKGLAYGPMEAVLQAIFQTLGTAGAEVSSDRCKVESVGPDMETWRKMQAEAKKQESKK